MQTRRFLTSLAAGLGIYLGGQAAAANLPTSSLFALADMASPTSPTSSGVNSVPKQSGPIVINWNIKTGSSKAIVIHGVKYEPVQQPANINLTINPDGSWNFSGSFPAKQGRDVDVVVGLKSSTGAIVLFHYAGSLNNGAIWDNQGKNETIKDNFNSFTPAHWYANYRMPLNSEGIALKYDQRKLKKEQEQNQKLKSELEKEKQEIAAEIARLQNDPNNTAPPSGGPSSILGDVTGALGSVVGGVTNTLGDIGKSILGIF